MNFEAPSSILFSDTQVPDIFVTEYMPSMDSDFVKVYIYCIFLCKHRKPVTVEELSKKLGQEQNRIKEALLYFESVGIAVRKEDCLVINDLKDREVKKVYRPKLTSTPEEAALSTERNKARNRVIAAINDTFFQGLMPPAWYTEIDSWFDRYGFEEDVMYALFQHCFNHKALTKSYIVKVADNWLSKGIKNSFDLDRYSMEYQKLKDIRSKISKKLKKSSQLTEYEEAYIEKWVADYCYDFNIIELALRRTTSITNPNFEYINRIISEWHERCLKTKEEIAEYEKSKRAGSSGTKKDTPVPQKNNFEQRKYDDDFYNNLYKNT